MIYLKFIRRCFTKYIPMAVKITSITTIAEIKYAERKRFLNKNWKYNDNPFNVLCNFNFLSMLKFILISRRLNVAVWLFAEKVKTVLRIKHYFDYSYFIKINCFCSPKKEVCFCRRHTHSKSKKSLEFILKDAFII